MNLSQAAWPSEFYCDKPRWCRIGATMKTSRAPSKTDAVHQALLATLESVKAQTQLLERIQPILGDVEQLGSEDPRFDMKRYTDEMWGDG